MGTYIIIRQKANTALKQMTTVEQVIEAGHVGTGAVGELLAYDNDGDLLLAVPSGMWVSAERLDGPAAQNNSLVIPG